MMAWVRAEPMSKATKSEAVRLGLGEFTSPEDGEAQTEARKQFLEAIREEAPEVLTTLAAEPQRLFQGMWDQSLASLPEEERHPLLLVVRLRWSPAFHWHRFKNAYPGHDPDGAEFADALRRWARQWNLDQSVDDWILERALTTLQEWTAFPERVLRDDLWWAEYYEATTVELTDEEQTVAFPRAYTWNPQFERKSAVRERIRSDFERHLADALDRIEAIANDRLTTPPKLTSGDAHFRWLVHYQVQDLDWDQIAERADRSAKQVREAARAIAHTVGIEPRKGTPRGRPRTHSLNEARLKRGSGSRTVRRTRPTTRRPEK
jgi:hypothetical protein